MMDYICLSLEGPLMSFGAPIIDQYGKIQPFPSLSMITGLVANALGFHHKDVDKLQRLQERIRFGSRENRPGAMLMDYQTVDLSMQHMSDEVAWTTQGSVQKRGGASGKVTHIRLRDYWVDSSHTVVLTLVPIDETPSLEEIADRLQHPDRPLFIGRKTCLPSSRMYSGMVSADSVKQALELAPLPSGDLTGRKSFRAWWPFEQSDDHDPFQRRQVTDERDWANQIHVGSRTIIESRIEINRHESQ